MVLLKTIEDHRRLSKTIEDYRRPSNTIEDYGRPNLLDYLSILKTIEDQRRSKTHIRSPYLAVMPNKPNFAPKLSTIKVFFFLLD